VKIEFRLITAAVVAAVLISAAVAGGARFRSLDEDAAIAFLQRTLKRDHVYESESHWIASRTALKARRTLILSLFSANAQLQMRRRS